MKDWATIRERYLRDPLPVRLGGLAANLARIKSFSDHPDHCEAVGSLLDECRYFIEWTAADAEVNTAAELVELQIQLAIWRRNWTAIWADTIQRLQIADLAHHWSRRVLEASGLLR